MEKEEILKSICKRSFEHKGERVELSNKVSKSLLGEEVVILNVKAGRKSKN